MRKKQREALKAMNLDLFRSESLVPPAPATMYTRIREAAVHTELSPAAAAVGLATTVADRKALPEEAELYQLFDHYNWLYFDGKLPRVKIEYSTRMKAAGSYSPRRKIIRIGRQYHEIFPDELPDTLKHEMIHILHFRHDRAFREMASRIGASVRARSHPALRKPPKFVYECPECGTEYPRQKRLVMASCGRCSSGRRFDARYKLRLKWSRRQSN